MDSISTPTLKLFFSTIRNLRREDLREIFNRASLRIQVAALFLSQLSATFVDQNISVVDFSNNLNDYGYEVAGLFIGLCFQPAFTRATLVQLVKFIQDNLLLNSSQILIKMSQWRSFTASFMMIAISELGDKTFIIAAILAMSNPRLTVFCGAAGALVIMTVLSAALGHVVPNLIPIYYTQILAGVLFLVFGVKMIKDAREMKGDEAAKEMQEVEHELLVAGTKKDEVAMEEGVPVSEPHSSPFKNLVTLVFSPVFVQAFTMTFLGELGDKSQITTIAMAAAENLLAVTVGASLAHLGCTALAIVGGRYLASKISIRTVTYIGGVGFIVFAFMSFYYATEE